MGQYDDIANIKTIKSKTGKDKIIYMGYSQGTVQMFYALAKFEEAYLADSLEKFVALAPCTFYDAQGVPETYYENSVYKFPALGVDELYGPNWTAKQKIICDTFDQSVCDAWQCTECETVATRSETHWLQNTYTGRFQEYAPKYLEGEKEAALIPLESIDKVPVAMVIGAKDALCTLKEAEKTKGILGDSVISFNSIAEYDHNSFAYVNDD